MIEFVNKVSTEQQYYKGHCLISNERDSWKCALDYWSKVLEGNSELKAWMVFLYKKTSVLIKETYKDTLDPSKSSCDLFIAASIASEDLRWILYKNKSVKQTIFKRSGSGIA